MAKGQMFTSQAQGKGAAPRMLRLSQRRNVFGLVPLGCGLRRRQCGRQARRAPHRSGRLEVMRHLDRS